MALDHESDEDHVAELIGYLYDVVLVVREWEAHAHSYQVDGL